MKKYKIPASIKLAQALLESNAGQSRLARMANNHFGIKCSRSWSGPCFNMDDDLPNEPFRQYATIMDSYNDHSLLLTQNARYSVLFKLDITDYKAWATTLQDAGYATDKKYASKLISLVEKYNLTEYDKKNAHTPDERRAIHLTTQYEFYKTFSGLLYVEAHEGDTYAGIAAELKFVSKNDLLKFNDATSSNTTLKTYEPVYLHEKKKKAEKPYYYHYVKDGETLHSISQLYGIQLKNLCKMNKKSTNFLPKEGDLLKLR
jgi:hypothetical protein